MISAQDSGPATSANPASFILSTELRDLGCRTLDKVVAEAFVAADRDLSGPDSLSSEMRVAVEKAMRASFDLDRVAYVDGQFGKPLEGLSASQKQLDFVAALERGFATHMRKLENSLYDHPERHIPPEMLGRGQRVGVDFEAVRDIWFATGPSEAIAAHEAAVLGHERALRKDFLDDFIRNFSLEAQAMGSEASLLPGDLTAIEATFRSCFDLDSGEFNRTAMRHIIAPLTAVVTPLQVSYLDSLVNDFSQRAALTQIPLLNFEEAIEGRFAHFVPLLDVIEVGRGVSVRVSNSASGSSTLEIRDSLNGQSWSLRDPDRSILTDECLREIAQQVPQAQGGAAASESQLSRFVDLLTNLQREAGLGALVVERRGIMMGLAEAYGGGRYVRASFAERMGDIEPIDVMRASRSVNYRFEVSNPQPSDWSSLSVSRTPEGVFLSLIGNEGQAAKNSRLIKSTEPSEIIVRLAGPDISLEDTGRLVSRVLGSLENSDVRRPAQPNGASGFVLSKIANELLSNYPVLRLANMSFVNEDLFNVKLSPGAEIRNVHVLGGKLSLNVVGRKVEEVGLVINGLRATKGALLELNGCGRSQLSALSADPSCTISGDIVGSSGNIAGLAPAKNIFAATLRLLGGRPSSGADISNLDWRGVAV